MGEKSINLIRLAVLIISSQCWLLLFQCICLAWNWGSGGWECLHLKAALWETSKSRESSRNQVDGNDWSWARLLKAHSYRKSCLCLSVVTTWSETNETCRVWESATRSRPGTGRSLSNEHLPLRKGCLTCDKSAANDGHASVPLG